MTAGPPYFDALTQPLQGFHSIEASAGTGKTYSITLLWLRLLIEQQLRVDQILVTTFTRAATAELQERLLAVLRKALVTAKNGASSAEEPVSRIVANAQTRRAKPSLVEELEAALSSFDLAPIHTIHGFCESLIGRHTLELGCDPGLELVDDAEDTLAEIVNDELMRQAELDAVPAAEALHVARAAVSNPLARLLDPITASEVVARSQARINPLLRQVTQLPIPSRSMGPIIRKLESMRDRGMASKLSEPQVQHLAPIWNELEQALCEVQSLHTALGSAGLHPIALLAREQFPRRKLLAKIRTFDDVLLTVYRALQIDGTQSPLLQAIHARLPAAIVDECQDSDSIQIGVFQQLFARSASFLVIGDPKQSIYRFRGADLSSYRALARGATKAAGMTTNHRSDLPMVQALNRLYAQHAIFGGSQPGDPIRYVQMSAAAQTARLTDLREAEPLLLLWSNCDDRSAAKRDLARKTAEEFRRLLDEPVMIEDRATQSLRRLCASDLAVLALSHSDLGLVRRELQAKNIPCEQAGASLGSVWKSDEALDAQTWLEAVSALEDRTDPLAAMLAFAATPLLGSSAAELDSLHENPSHQAALAQQLRSDGTALRFAGPLPLLQHYWGNGEQLSLRLSDRDGERRITNWRQIGCLLQEQWSQGRWRAGELALWLSRKRGQMADTGETTLMKLETDLPAVQLATVFAAKGLEYPIVCCPFLWHVNSRKYRRLTPLAIVRHASDAFIDIGSEHFVEHLDEAIQQEDEEQERMLYVALTRARHRVYVGLAPVVTGETHDNGADHSALAALLGLAQLDKSEWHARCPIPLLATSPTLATVTSESTVADAAIQLAPAPDITGHAGPLTRCSSYSALTRSGEATTKDYDPEDPATRMKVPGLLADLNLTGNRLGQRIHQLLEQVLGNGRSVDAVTEHLPAEWKTALITILETPLTLGTTTAQLWQIRTHAIAEMHVMLPVSAISPSNLAKALLCDPAIAGDPERRIWADELAHWSFGTLTGYFQGYIDLIFEHGGRFYIVDYKTNALQGYDPTSIESAMLHHHYLLQARLYTVALHRHLKASMTDYDPEVHLGGCAYLFVRGFPEQGVWFEPASLVGIEALDRLFAQATT